MQLNEAVYGAKRSAIREFSKLANKTPGCIALTLGEPDLATPQPVCNAVPEALTAGQTHYIENNGTYALREAIARFEREKNGMDYTPDEVIVTVGATQALFVALFGILNPGDEVIVPTPAFVLYEQIIGLCRGTFIPYDTTPDSFQLNADRLRALITPNTKAIILNSPNNPTGCVYNVQSLQAVHDVVQGREIFVICDDVYNRLVYTEGYERFALRHPELREQIVVVDSFSKPWAMTGWRIGWLAAAPSLAVQIAKAHQYMVSSAVAFEMPAAAAALSVDPAPMLETYRARRARVLAALEKMGLSVVEPAGAFYVFPSIKGTGLTSEQFCTRAIEEAGVGLVPGSCFGSEGYVRLSYCVSDEDLDEGLRRLDRFVMGL